MINKIEYQNPGSDKESVLGKKMKLLSELNDNDIDENEHIVTTLYAKPGINKPFLTLSKLRNGTYEETSYLGLKSYLHFSDVGSAAWNAALEMDRNSAIKLVRASMLEEDKSWEVIIKNQYLAVMLNSVRFKPIGKYTSAFYISLEISGKPAPLMAYVKGVMEALKRNPWENQSGELDWSKFTKKTYTQRNEVKEQWVLFSGLPEPAPEYLEEIGKPLCRRCKKRMEEGWVLCPFCGESLNDSHIDY